MNNPTGLACGKAGTLQVNRRDALKLTAGAAIGATALAGRFHAAGAQGTGTPVVAPVEKLDHAALDALLKQHVDSGAAPGVAAGVWTANDEWISAHGVGDTETKAPLLPADKFRIASNTKTFTATAVLQLVDQGKISLDDVIEKYVPDVPNGKIATIDQLLGMTAGIYGFAEDAKISSEFYADPTMAFTPQDALDIARSHPPDFAPGTSFHYSDTNYVVAGLILEKVTGQAAGTLITDTLIKPLGLTNTSFATTPEMEPPYSHGYYKNTDGTLHDVTASNPSFAWTAGAIVSTLADLAVWVKAITDGSLLSAETQARRLAWTSIPGKKTPISYGLGIMDVLGFQGHNGAIAGYSSFMVRSPDLDTTVNCFTNLSDNDAGDANELFFDIVKMLYPALSPK